MAERGRLVRIS